MNCAACGKPTHVKDSRPTTVGGLTAIRRRRMCVGCGVRFTTLECTDVSRVGFTKIAAVTTAMNVIESAVMRAKKIIDPTPSDSNDSGEG